MITWILEVAAVALAIIAIILKDMPINPVGIIATAGAGALSWLNARSYSEASISYGLVAHELALLEDRGSHASTEDKLANIVLDAENKINQEHKIWIARLL